MKIITPKESKKFSLFLIGAGMAGLYLTLIWYFVLRGGGGDIEEGFESINIVYYFIFNSTLLLTLGVLLRYRKFKLYSYFSIILAIFVTSSLFFYPDKVEHNVLNNLFLYTVFIGISLGSVYGGFVLVPMFLMGVYKSLIRGIKYFDKSLIYSFTDVDYTNNETNDENILTSAEKEISEPKKNKLIPYMGLIYSIFNFLKIYNNLSNGPITVIPKIFIFSYLLLLIISIISLKTNKYKISLTLNWIIVFIVILPYILPFITNTIWMLRYLINK